jgi:plastocyanin
VRIRSSLPALAAATLVLAAAGCGSGGGYGGGGGSATASGDGGGGGGKTVSLSADPGGALKFSTREIKVDSGTKTVTVSLKNPSSVEHAIASGDQKGQLVGKGGTSTITLTGLSDGKYTLFCPVPGHAAAGMKATLVVGSGSGGGTSSGGRYGY